MSRQLERDSFARATLIRERVYVKSHGLVTGRGSCAWCGGIHTTPKGRTYLFAYYSEPDVRLFSCRAPGTNRHAATAWEKLFCSRSCWEAYSS